VTKFEDLDAWRKSRELTRLIYLASAQGEFGRDFALRDQIRRAAVSVLSNIAEGFERCGDREFHHFLSMAKGSIGEVRAQLHVALDLGFLSEDQFKDLHARAYEIGRMLGGLLRYLDRSGSNGLRSRRERQTGGP
jgi:four helix bundle protein